MEHLCKLPKYLLVLKKMDGKGGVKEGEEL